MPAGLYAVQSAMVWGAEALAVTTEVSLSGGVPGFSIVGRPDTSVLDAAARVRSAMGESGYDPLRLHATVNLAPGELRKSGTGFDLPIAVATLAAAGQIPIDGLDEALFVGELGLDGVVCPVRGMVAYALLARQLGLVLVASADCRLPDSLSGLLCPISSLSELKFGLDDLETRRGVRRKSWTPSIVAPRLDYADVVDQEIAKRAFVIAAAGRHGLLMMGPPGSGKTMLARRMPTILPAMSVEEQIETLIIHSVAGEAGNMDSSLGRPFRAPHHSVTAAGMVGGGRPVLPGEVSLAHHGVLFLDELPEFAPNVLQMLRQPMEDKHVCIVRADGDYDFPCDFQLVAAANPCPCGYLGDPGHECRCAPAVIDRYQGRIGGPLMDRIDMLVNVARPSGRRVVSGGESTSSESMRTQVEEAREFATWRREHVHDVVGSASGATGLAESELLDEGAERLLIDVAERMAFGGRALSRVARVARTIADLSKSERVSAEHVMEASSFRATLGEM